jgi:hypothetical protein
LTVDHLWKATNSLIEVPEIGRAIALNSVKDAGYPHAFKPDTHTRKVAGQAFRENEKEYEVNDNCCCVGAALAFAQVSEAHGTWNDRSMSLAAVDRLMWLAGSGDLRVADGNAKPLKAKSAAGYRRKKIAGILRKAARPGRFGG